MGVRAKRYIISAPRNALWFLTVFATNSCFRPAPPLEDGDGLSPSYTTQVDPDGSTTMQGHPAVLKRQKNESKSVDGPTQSSSGPIVPQTAVPQTAVPQTAVPQTAVPQTTVPQTTVPQNNVAQWGSSLTAINVVGLKPILTGSCDPAALSHTVSSTSGSVRSVTCDGNGFLSVVVHLPSGSAPFSVSVKTTRADGSTDTNTTSFSRTPFDCPIGYVGVPGSGIPGLGNVNASKGNPSWWLDVDRDFCVMKYPAKNNNGSTYASSTMSGLPWTRIARGMDESETGSAFKACKDIPGGTYRLISNSQWQTVARNLESVAANWNGGVVGNGAMYISKAQFLSNTEYVFDFGGNVQQWVSDQSSALGLSPLIGPGYQEFSAAVFPVTGNSSGINRLIFAPLGVFDSKNGVGQIYGGNGAVRRGGAGQDGANCGPFWAALNYYESTAAYEVGFRCAHLP